MHHDIEETYVFPKLAKKMEIFKHSSKQGGLMVEHHKLIHAGLEQLEDYLSKCRQGETELRYDELKIKMDSFGSVLWTHLDEEVKQLQAENMRKYWTLAEMRGLSF
jgi:hemerythrin-like domain-containing protein